MKAYWGSGSIAPQRKKIPSLPQPGTEPRSVWPKMTRWSPVQETGGSVHSNVIRRKLYAAIYVCLLVELEEFAENISNDWSRWINKTNPNKPNEMSQTRRTNYLSSNTAWRFNTANTKSISSIPTCLLKVATHISYVRWLSSICLLLMTLFQPPRFCSVEW
jgi:hypothetical protein